MNFFHGAQSIVCAAGFCNGGGGSGFAVAATAGAVFVGAAGGGVAGFGVAVGNAAIVRSGADDATGAVSKCFQPNQPAIPTIPASIRIVNHAPPAAE